MRSFRLTPLRAAIASGLYVALWQGLVLALPAEAWIALSGWVGAYLIGFAWAVYLLDRASRRVEARRVSTDTHTRPEVSVSGETADARRGGWNPFDPAARYYSAGPGVTLFIVCAVLGAAATAPMLVLVPVFALGKLLLAFCDDVRPVAYTALGLATVGIVATFVPNKVARRVIAIAGLACFLLLGLASTVAQVLDYYDIYPVEDSLRGYASGSVLILAVGGLATAVTGGRRIFRAVSGAGLAYHVFVPVAIITAWQVSVPVLATGVVAVLQNLHQFCEWIQPIGNISLIFATACLATAIARSNRVRQSLSMVAVYSILFALVYFLAHMQSTAASEEQEYDLPAGGGNDSPQAMSVKVQKVIRKRYVINPYSNIAMNAPPPIDNIDVKLIEDTANRYQVGMGDGGLGSGDGEGGGFGSGKDGGKIRFIRLRHSDKSWDKNFGIGGDRNLLTELVVRFPKMNGKVAEETEAMDIATLNTFKQKASPPLVYIGGAGTFAPTAADKRILKAYLTERHGMILGDCLGAGGFHGNFIAAMTEIVGTGPVDIPRDDPIHKRPYEIPQLPIVVAHGGTVARGWKIDGRWAVYYHPGALSDAWRDDRAGIKKPIADQCYLLGINIISYAHREHDQWRRSQQP